ncbi:MAG: zf-HC2 domain-containing protein [Thermomicrobiales bacterium]
MPTNERQANRPQDHLTDAELNELVDGTLAGRDADKAQAHLAGCASCEERYQTLLATVTALRQAPSVMPRRSFQLTPAQARLPEPKQSWLDRFAERLLPGVPAIKAATIAVALLFISVTAFDVLTNQSAQESMGPTTVKQEADVPAPTFEAPQTAATEPSGRVETAGNAAPEPDSALQESATGGGAQTAAETSDEPDGESMSESAADSAPVEDGFTSSAMQEAPAAPAAAMEPGLASPTAEPTATPTPTPEATATATPTATPAPASDGWSSEFTLSWWRIAELALLMILIWLIVTWFGRRGVDSLD